MADETKAHSFSADRAISGRDADRLGRRDFAEALASSIEGWSGRDSLVIALYGPWGTGKSSVKNMTVQALDLREGSNVVVAEFNPWQFANRDQLTEAFFDQIGVALGRGRFASQKDRKAALDKWRRYAAYLKAGRGLVGILSKPILWTMGLSGIVLLGATAPAAHGLMVWTAMALIGGALLLAWSTRAARAVAAFFEPGVEIGKKSLEEVKVELGRELSKLRGPILVVVDDADRLTPQEIQQLFQLVKANADFPNLVYLLIFDRSVVERAIERVVQVPGREYIEKIVQVGFDIPAIERPKLQRILFEDLDRTLDHPAISKHFDQTRWGNLFFGALHSYFRTLRDVNRFVSTVDFHAALLHRGGSFAVNPVDLIGLEVLRMFEPEVYRALSGHKRILTGASERLGRDDEDRQALQNLIAIAPEDRRDGVREIVKQLFPAAEWAFGGAHYAHGITEEWTRSLRVASAEIFGRYFHLAIPEGDIPQATMDRLLASAGNREELRRELQGLKEQGLLTVALERLEAYKQALPLEYAEPFITAVFDIGEELPEERAGLLEIAPAMHATRIVYWYLRREQQTERRLAVLRNAIRNTTGISLPVHVVSVEELAAGPNGQRGERLLIDEGLTELKQLALEKIEAAAQGRQLRNAAQLLSILDRWKDWAGIDPPRAFCIELVQTPEGALILAKACLVRSSSYGLGDHVGRERQYVRLSDLEEFAPWETMEIHFEGIDTAAQPDVDRRVIDAFRGAVARRRRGQPDPGGFRAGDDDE